MRKARMSSSSNLSTLLAIQSRHILINDISRPVFSAPFTLVGAAEVRDRRSLRSEVLDRRTPPNAEHNSCCWVFSPQVFSDPWKGQNCARGTNSLLAYITLAKFSPSILSGVSSPGPCQSVSLIGVLVGASYITPAVPKELSFFHSLRTH